MPGTRFVWATLACLLVLRAGWWHWRGGHRFLLDRDQVQARRNLAGRHWYGMAYFGWILGTTIMTQMTTPLVPALGALGAAAGPLFGVTAGIGLGMARSVAPWAGARAGGWTAPAAVIQRFGRRARGFRRAGIAMAAVMLAIAILWWPRP